MNKYQKTVVALVLVLAAVCSILLGAGWATNPDTYEKTIAALDKNAATVLRLAAASTAASVGISMIPDDTATPIADKLADFAEYFLLILCVLYGEKYLLTILGAAVFRFVIPAACLALIVGLLWKPEAMHRLAFKFLLFAVAASLAIPLSVVASEKITETYQQNMESVIASTEEFSDSTEQLSLANGDKGVLSTILQSMSETVSSLLNKASNLMNHFIELLAVMIVTSCLIPMMVLLFFLWLIRTVTGVSIPVRPFRGEGRRREAPERE